MAGRWPAYGYEQRAEDGLQ
jgi:hypothetical protein